MERTGVGMAKEGGGGAQRTGWMKAIEVRWERRGEVQRGEKGRKGGAGRGKVRRGRRQVISNQRHSISHIPGNYNITEFSEDIKLN